MKLKLSIIFLIILSSCGSEDRIQNTIEARWFLSNYQWHDPSASFMTKDGEYHTAGSSVKFTNEEVLSNNQKYYYSIVKKEGGDEISLEPYFEVTWFDNYLNENVIFHLYENGGGSLFSTRWKMTVLANVDKPIVHISMDEANKKEEEYKRMHELYKIVENLPVIDSNEGSKNLNEIQVNENENALPLFQGKRVFCDSMNNMYYIVTVVDEYINLHLYEGNYNKNDSIRKSVNVIGGKIMDNIRIVTKNKQGVEEEIFFYYQGKLQEIGYEESKTTYIECE